MGKVKSNKSKSNKLLSIGIALIVIAVLLIGGGLFMIINKDDENTVTPQNFSAVGEEDSATACQNLMSSYFSAIMGEDGEELYKLMAPPEYWTYYMETYSKTEEEVISTYDDAINNTKSTWKAKCGDDAKVSFQIISSGNQSDSLLNEWNENVGSHLGENKPTAEEAVTLNIHQTVTGSNGTIESDILPTLIKIDGKWYILNEGVNGE